MVLSRFYILLWYFSVYSLTKLGYGLECYNLEGRWNLSSIDSKYKNLNAIVPGGIYSDLMNNKIIDDVFYGFNDANTRWVGKEDWLYSKVFNVNATLLNHEYINLILNGVDTFSEISINNQLIGKTDNMFVRYEYDIKNILQLGTNEITIKFFSPIRKANESYDDQLKLYEVPPECIPNEYRGECHVNHIRKMQASFAWDWGPAFPSVGIWKSIYLESYNSSLIRDVVINTVKNDVSLEWEIYVTTYFAQNANYIKGNLILKLFTDLDDFEVINPVEISKNEDDDYCVTHKISFPLNHVKLWWPNGYGDANLYVLKMTYINKEKDEQHSKRYKIGFRKIELIQNEMQNSSFGREFLFKINDQVIFAKGTNVIPISILPEKENKSTIKYLLQSAKDVHMNMLRVWGGGIYESDEFYSIADELGLLIWQDFMFACSMYPTNDEFLRSVYAEIKYQTRRLQYHPSIVIWSGNNENEAALRQNWYGTAKNFTLYKKDYIKLYIDNIRKIVLKFDPSREFLVSSPTNGIESEQEGYVAENPSSNLYGDIHYYNYIQDGWNKNIFPKPRFASEYGYQSLPSIKTLLKATNNKTDLNIDSEFLNHRQHHPNGYSEMKLIMDYQFNLTNTNSSKYSKTFIFFSQIYQAMATKAETEHYRSLMRNINEEGEGWTYGALYWQLNDVWVAPTWSGIDFDQNWKMLHYYAKEFFAPTIITGHINVDRSVDIHVVNDLIPHYNSNVFIKIYNWQSFTPIATINLTLDIPAERSTRINYNINEIDIFLSDYGCGTIVTSKFNCFLLLEVQNTAQKTIAPFNYILPSSIKTVNLFNPDIKISSIRSVNNISFEIEIETNGIALFVWLDSDFKGRFSENGFFQIAPKKVVSFFSENVITIDEFKKSLVLTHFLDDKYKLQ